MAGTDGEVAEPELSVPEAVAIVPGPVAGELKGIETAEEAEVVGFGATHFVHMVEVIVLRIVDTVNELCTT